MRRHAGFSLPEVLVAAAIVGLVMFYMSELLVRQSRTYTVVDNISEAQQNLRALANLIESEARNTGYVVNAGAALCGYDTDTAGFDTDPDVLFVTDASAIAAPLAKDGAGVELYPGAPVSASGNPGANVTNTVANISAAAGTAATAASVVLSSLVVDNHPHYDVDGDSVKDSDFQFSAGSGRRGGVVLVQKGDSSQGAACGLITDINGTTLTVDFTVNGAQSQSGLKTTANPTNLAAIPAHVYWIENDASGTPQLMRDGIVLAPDVEDLQFAAFYDYDDDGLVTGVAVGNTAPPFHSTLEYPGSDDVNSRFLSSAIDNAKLREIRVTLVLRTRTQDPEVLINPAFAQQMRQPSENRNPTGPPDGFRRRSLTVTVQPRNIARRAVF